MTGSSMGRIRRSIKPTISVAAVTCTLLAGAIATAVPAAADPAGTIVLASGTSASPTTFYLHAASSSYVLFKDGPFYSSAAVHTVPIAGGAAVNVPAPITDDWDPRLVGSLVTPKSRPTP